MEKGPPGAGKSTFELIDPEILFRELHLKEGTSFLDLGCGRGEYAIAAAEFTGEEGQIYGIDLWAEGIAVLQEQASAKGLRNLTGWVGDMRKRLPLNDRSIDVCLMAAVLHDLGEADADKTLDEVRRVLTQEGLLAVVEFKKNEGPPGPPFRIRLAPEDISRIVTPHGFTERRVLEVGPYHYLVTFRP
jgi:ubiquinone/menaquinone biosynthesis C-methylase UbiE